MLLEDLKLCCPMCMNTTAFSVSTTTQMYIHDDVRGVTHNIIDDDPCKCQQCDFEGCVGDFTSAVNPTDVVEIPAQGWRDILRILKAGGHSTVGCGDATHGGWEGVSVRHASGDEVGRFHLRTSTHHVTVEALKNLAAKCRTHDFPNMPVADALCIADSAILLYEEGEDDD